MDGILDDDFGLSHGEDSEMEGEDIYRYLGWLVLDHWDVENLSHGISPSNDNKDADDCDDPMNNNERKQAQGEERRW